MIPGWFAKFVRRWGFIKMPEGTGGVHAGGMLGFSNLGNKRKQLEAYQNHVYKCVTLIYRRAISVSARLYKERGDEDEEIKQHPYIDLMRRPNPYMTGRLLKAMTIMHLDLAGVAFWRKIYNTLGRPAELWPLPPGNFSRFVLNEAKTELIKYEFKTDEGRPVTYDPEEIVYFRYPHPLYFLEGASPIQQMAMSYDTDLAMRVYQRRFFQNAARPDVTLETEQDISKEDAKRVLMGFKEAHQGVEKSWEPALLDKGLKANILSVNAKDMEFASLAGLTKEDILEAYNIPEGKLGSIKDVNRANALGIDITFNSECISPRLDLYDETVTNGVVADYDKGLYLKHDKCIPRDREFDLKERESNLKSFYTVVNEERAKDGLEAVSWGDAPFVPISSIQWGEEPGIVREQTAHGAQLKAIDTKDAQENFRLGHERRVAARSRAFRAWLRQFFKAQKQEVSNNLDQHYPRVEGAIGGMSVKKAKAWLKEHKDAVDRINFDLNRANKDLIKGSGPYAQGAVIAGGEEALALVDVDIIFDMLSPEAAQFLKSKDIVLREVNRVTYDAIRAELAEGFEAGESMRQISARISKVYNQADQVRSLRIAQTEINSAANFGSLEGYRQSGVVERKEWLAGGDARDTHQMAAARYSGDGAIPLDQDFEVGAGRGPAPGSIGLAEEDINCRCCLLPVVNKE